MFDWKDKRVLVTGGAGFVGSHVTEALLGRGAKVTIADNFSTGFREFVNPSPHVTLIEGDLADPAVCDRAAAKQDFVFHFAANADVRKGFSHPRRDIDQNLIVTHNLIEAMRANGVKSMALSSSGSVYGESSVIPTPEDAPFPIQTSLYAATKVAAEGLLTAYAHGFGFKVWIFRFVSLLGPRYTHGHIIDFWKKLREDPSRLEVLGDGHQRKSYLHIADCVAGMLMAVERARDAVSIFNVGHSDWIEVNDSLRIICKEMRVNPTFQYGGGVRGWVGDSPRILLDTTRLRALGWAPTHSLEESVVETLRFLMEHPHTANAR